MNQIKTARSALNYLDSGCSRDDWVRLGMAAKAAGLEFEDFHNWSKFGGNYSTEKDCKAAWKSFNESGGITAATLFHIAKGKGWKDPFKTISNTSNEKLHCTKRKAPKTLHTNEQSTRVLEIWEKCVSASPAHEYIMRKQGRPDSLRVYPTNAPTLTINGQNVADYLVVPCLSDGIPQTLQFISPKEGKKLNLGGASFNDGYFVVGNITETTPKIYPTESIGNAWAIFQASNAPSVVFFGSSRMPRVTKLLRDKYPNTQLILVPDRGKENQAAEIASDIDCHWIALPQDKHENYDVNDYAHEYSYDALATLLGNVKASEMRYKLLSGADLIGMPPMGWLVRGVIPNKGLAALYGANGSGKSFLILDMGCAVAAGDKFWFGHSITQVPVTYVSLEGEAGMGKRVKAWSLHFKKPIPNLLRFITQPFNLLSDDVLELAKAVTTAGGTNGLLIIDTLNRAASGADENSSVDMGKIIAAAQQLQSLIGGLVLLVHHAGKNPTKGLRGHSSLYASLDSAIEVIKTDSQRHWNVAKSKDDITGIVRSFRLEITQIGRDEQGNDITSCIVLHDVSNDVLKMKKTLLGSNQSIALVVAKDLLSQSAHKGKNEAPSETPCIHYDQLLAQTAEQMPTGARHRKSSALTAIAGLVKKGYLSMKGDWLWSI